MDLGSLFGGPCTNTEQQLSLLSRLLWFVVYSVMQSDGNSFCGDVVWDGFNMSYRDEDSILEQHYENQISWDLYYKDFIFLK